MGNRAVGETSRPAARTRRLLGATAVVAVAAGDGALYQAVETARDRERYPRPGRLVDVGGHGLHLDIKGEDKEGPTLVLEIGEAGAPPSSPASIRPSPSSRGWSTTNAPGSATASPARSHGTRARSRGSSTRR